PTAYTTPLGCGDHATGPNITFVGSAALQLLPPSVESAIPRPVATIRRESRGSTATPITIPVAVCSHLRPVRESQIPRDMSPTTSRPVGVTATCIIAPFTSDETSRNEKPPSVDR